MTTYYFIVGKERFKMQASDRQITGFTTLGHALFHTYELSIPLFIGLWIEEFGLSAALAGLVVGVGYALIGLGAPVSGILSDYFGSRRLILLSVLGMGGGFALIGTAQGPLSLAVFVALWGAFASLYHPAGLSLISRMASQRGTVFAYHGAGGNVGTAVGPLSTAVLLSVLHWRMTAMLLFVPAVVAAFVGMQITFDEEENRTGDRPDSIRHALWETFGNSRRLFTVGFSIAFLSVLLYGTYYRGLLTFLPDILGNSSLDDVTLLSQSFDPAEYIYSSMLAVGIAGQYMGGKLTDRIQSRTAFLGALSSLVVLALLFIVVQGEGFLPLVLVSLALGFFVYATAPIYQVVIAEEVPSESHGLSYGYTYLAMFGIGAVGATIAGALLTYATVTALFVALAVLAATGCLCLVVLRNL